MGHWNPGWFICPNYRYAHDITTPFKTYIGNQIFKLTILFSYNIYYIITSYIWSNGLETYTDSHDCKMRLETETKVPHYAEKIFKLTSWYETCWIITSLKFIRKGPFNNTSTLVQIMAWRRVDTKPLTNLVYMSQLIDTFKSHHSFMQ